MGVLRETDDEIPVLLLGWFYTIAGFVGIAVAWFPTNGYDLVILVVGAVALGIGLWMIVKAFIHYRRTGLVETAKLYWFMITTEVKRGA